MAFRKNSSVFCFTNESPITFPILSCIRETSSILMHIKNIAIKIQPFFVLCLEIKYAVTPTNKHNVLENHVGKLASKVISIKLLSSIEENILVTEVKKHFVLTSTGGRTDLVFSLKENDVDYSKLAMWRLKFGDACWLSDFVVNYAEHYGHLPEDTTEDDFGEEEDHY